MGERSTISRTQKRPILCSVELRRTPLWAVRSGEWCYAVTFPLSAMPYLLTGDLPSGYNRSLRLKTHEEQS